MPNKKAAAKKSSMVMETFERRSVKKSLKRRSEILESSAILELGEESQKKSNKVLQQLKMNSGNNLPVDINELMRWASTGPNNETMTVTGTSTKTLGGGYEHFESPPVQSRDSAYPFAEFTEWTNTTNTNTNITTAKGKSGKKGSLGEKTTASSDKKGRSTKAGPITSKTADLADGTADDTDVTRQPSDNGTELKPRIKSRIWLVCTVLLIAFTILSILSIILYFLVIQYRNEKRENDEIMGHIFKIVPIQSTIAVYTDSTVSPAAPSTDSTVSSSSTIQPTPADGSCPKASFKAHSLPPNDDPKPYKVEYQTATVLPIQYNLKLRFEPFRMSGTAEEDYLAWWKSYNSQSSASSAGRRTLDRYHRTFWGDLEIDLKVVKDVEEFSLNVNRENVNFMENELLTRLVEIEIAENTSERETAENTATVGESLGERGERRPGGLKTGKQICIKLIERIGKDQLKFTLLNRLAPIAENDDTTKYYKLIFPQFRSTVRPESPVIQFGIASPAGSATQQPTLKEKVQSYAVWTDFHGTGQAQTVFPCFDHPRMKARFNLTLTYTKPETLRQLKTISVAPIKSVESSHFWGSQTVQFELTPPILPEMLTFSLIHRTKEVTSTDVRIELDEDAYRKAKAAKGNGLKGLTTIASFVNKIRNFIHLYITKKEPFAEKGSTKTAILITPGPASSGNDVTSFAGLIILNSRLAYDTNILVLGRQRDRIEKLLVYHVIKQWLSYAVTFNERSEICLYEGLTEWLTNVCIRSKRTDDENQPSATASEKWPEMDRKREESLAVKGGLLGELGSEEEIRQKCHAKAALVFHTISFFGSCPPKTLKNFYMRLFNMHWYSNAGFSDWVRLMNRTVAHGGSVLKSYFTKPGYPLIMLSLKGDTQLHWRQIPETNPLDQNKDTEGYGDGDNRASLSTNNVSTEPFGSPFMLVLSFKLIPSGDFVKLIMDKENGRENVAKGTKGVILDDRTGLLSVSRILYSVDNYRLLLSSICGRSGPSNKKACSLNSRNFKVIISDLCYGLLRNKFVLNADNDGDREKWKGVVELLVRISNHKKGSPGIVPKVCKCCLIKKSDDSSSNNDDTDDPPLLCSKARKNVCSSIDLLKGLGYVF